MLLENIGEPAAAQKVEQAVITLVATKVSSLAAGKMGYGTREIGDMVVELIK